MVLRVVRGGTGSELADALAARLQVPLDDPFATEEVVVHSRGMERWLSQHLSHRLGVSSDGDGICANVAFPFPIDVVRRAIRAAGGPDPRFSVWSPDRLVWPLLRMIEEGLGIWAAPLTDRLARDPAERFGILRGVADLFDRYQAHRPDLVLQWLDGVDVDAAGQPLMPSDTWQPALFRHLRARLKQPTLAESVIAATANMMMPNDIPARLSLFGFTALPAAHLAILASLATVVDVDLYLLHPSPVLWARWARSPVDAGLAPEGLPQLPLRSQLGLTPPRNGLLRSWGRDVRELQVVVAAIAGSDDDSVLDHTDPPVTARLASTNDDSPDSTLVRLQGSVRADTDLAAGAAAARDDSVQVHACHGQARQVQVLRDQILQLMADDPTLQPRDIVVMCPDVETFAPLVNAHLAVPSDDPDGRPDLRVRLADRALRQVNPMLRIIEELLRLAAGRVTAARLLDLAGSDPVRRRFAFSDDDLQRLAAWADDSGMRWGLNVTDRQRDGVDEGSGTIAFGLSRMLLGAAMADEAHRTIGGITPLDDVEGNDVTLAGRFAELVSRLDSVLSSFRGQMSVTDWIDAITRAADLLLREPDRDPWQRIQVNELLSDLAAEAAASRDGDSDSAQVDATSGVALGLPEIRAALGERLQGQPSWANHRTGDLTVCTLVPMRTVPHRVVCLLGMDDEVFPRRTHTRGDDLIARHPRVGDSDPRTEDRQLLLDAIMAAGDAVIITYSGIDPRSGHQRPPCVPIAELLRTLHPMVSVTTHPLQPYHPQVFTGDRPGFDPQAHAAATAARRPSTPRPTVQPPLELDLVGVVNIEHLVSFAQDPAAHFYRQTVGAYVPTDPEHRSQHLPLTLGGLTQWGLGQHLLDDAPDGDVATVQAIVTAGRGRGDLPPEPWGHKQIDKVSDSTAEIAGLMRRVGLPVAPGGVVEISAMVGPREVVGTVGDIHGHRHVVRSFSKIKAKSIIAAWVRLLALTATQPDHPWEAYVAGRHEQKQGWRNPAHIVHFPPLGDTPATRGQRAIDLLNDLVALHDDGLREPLVAPALTAAAYAIERVLRRQPPDLADDAAAPRWDHDDHSFDNEADNPAHLLLFGDAVGYDVLRRQPPRDTDTRPGHEPEPHRFGGLAMRLWAPVLVHCKAVTP